MKYELLLRAIQTLSNEEQALVTQLLTKAKQNLKAQQEQEAAFGTCYQQHLVQRMATAHLH